MFTLRHSSHQRPSRLSTRLFSTGRPGPISIFLRQMAMLRGLWPGHFGGVDAAPKFIGRALAAKKDVAQIALPFAAHVWRSFGKGLFCCIQTRSLD